MLGRILRRELGGFNRRLRDALANERSGSCQFNRNGGSDPPGVPRYVLRYLP